MGSHDKYEMGHDTGDRLYRVLFSSIHYPVDHGFIAGTEPTDGYPLNAHIIVEEPTGPG